MAVGKKRERGSNIKAVGKNISGVKGKGTEVLKNNGDGEDYQVVLNFIHPWMQDLHLPEADDGFAPAEDRPLNQFILADHFQLPDMLRKVWNIFKYYSDQENQDELVKSIMANKNMLNTSYTKESGGYRIRGSRLGEVFQAVLVAALEVEYTAPLLLIPEHLFILNNSRIPLSDSNLLAMAIIHLGKGYNSCAMEIIIPYMIDHLQKKTVGLSQMDWSPDRMETAAINLRSDLIDRDIFRQEGRMITFDSIVDVSMIKLNIMTAVQNVRKFVELPLPPDLLASFGDVKLKREPPCPPVPRDFLLALALRNLAPQPGAPVPFSTIWAFLTDLFPYLRPQQPWTTEELVQVFREVCPNFGHPALASSFTKCKFSQMK